MINDATKFEPPSHWKQYHKRLTRDVHSRKYQLVFLYEYLHEANWICVRKSLCFTITPVIRSNSLRESIPKSIWFVNSGFVFAVSGFERFFVSNFLMVVAKWIVDPENTQNFTPITGS